MSSDIIRKPDKDFTKEADKLIPEAQELAKAGIVSSLQSPPVLTCCAQDNVQAAIDKLLGLEKQTRQVSPFPVWPRFCSDDECIRRQISPLPQGCWLPSSQYVKTLETGVYSTSKSYFFRRSMDSSSKLRRRWCRW